MSDPHKARIELRRRRLRRRRRIAVAAAAIGAIGAGQWLGRTAGSTRAERRQPLPGDELVHHPSVVTNHATTIPTPPQRVWPWLVQMGWHRGGWYTRRWVDRLLFPGNWPSATHLVPELQRPLSHLPASWRARLGAAIDWSWTFTLADTGEGGTRLLLRVRASTRPWWLTGTYLAVLVPADYVMASSMLAGIRRRAAPARQHKGPSGTAGSRGSRAIA